MTNISPAWPIERQEAVLAGKGVRYQDVLKKAQLKDLKPDMLLNRSRMLALTTRQETETIYVASLVCLAVNLPDLCDTLAAATVRKATIIALDAGLEIPTGADFRLFAKVAQAFQKAKRSPGTAEGRVKGWIKAVENRQADTKRRLALIADDWKRRDHTDAELFLRAATKTGKPMSRNTAIGALGKRKDAQKKWDDHLAYIARKDTKHDL